MKAFLMLFMGLALVCAESSTSANAQEAVAPAVQEIPEAAPVSDREIRKELARKLNEVNPVSLQVKTSVARIARDWGLAEKEKFEKELLAEINLPEIEKKSIESLAEVYTAAELQVMLDYYSKPEAASIAEKMPIYQGLVQPGISRELDRALMKLRTGYESRGTASP